MSILDQTTFANALKTVYTTEKIENLVYSVNPWLAMIPKDTKFRGKNFTFSVRYGVPQGRSATFSTAQSNLVASKIAEFVVTRASDYAIAQIANETIKASEGDLAAFAEAVTFEMDGAFQSCGNSLATALFGDGSGRIGQVDSSTTLSGTTLTLKNTDDVVKFEVGQVLVVSANSDGTSIRSGSLTVTAVNRKTGVITCSAALNSGIGSIAANDYIYVSGDQALKVTGLDGWIPTSDPSATTFFSQDRTPDPTRLAGVRYDGSGLSVEEACVKGLAQLYREGDGIADLALMSPTQYANLELALGARVRYVDIATNTATVGFRGIELQGMNGPLKCVADRSCGSDRIYLLKSDTWCLRSLGDAPQVLNSDGNEMLRVYNADSNELRVGYYANVTCKAPGHNAVITGLST